MESKEKCKIAIAKWETKVNIGNGGGGGVQ